MRNTATDIVVVGAGIIGLATARALRRRFPALSVRIVEKEDAVARHQTGHNSGVIHAGIYYKPGSYKARLCTQGVRLMKEFCDAHAIPYENCGKVVVATDDAEIPRLEELLARGIANGVPGLEMIGPSRIHEIEPHARAVRAVYSPETAIVDYGRVALAMADDLRADGVDLRFSTTVERVEARGAGLRVHTTGDVFEATWLVNCAGLHSDAVARATGLQPEVQIVPFRGEYYTLHPGQTLVRGLIYPVPDPSFPFLGVHFTKRIGGEFEAGPNAVLAFAREGYRFGDINGRDMARLARYRGFWAMAGRYWRTGIEEFARSLSKRAFTRALQKLVPEIQPGDLMPGGSGVRAQAVARNGALVDDFEIVSSPRAIHVVNAPSPAATASLAIGDHIAHIAAAEFDLESATAAG